MSRFRLPALGLAGVTLFPVGCARPQPAPLVVEALVSAPDNGGSLTGPSTDAAIDVVRRYMAETRAGDLSRSLVVANERTRDGLRLLRLEQHTTGGLRIHGAYAKAALDDTGALVHAIDALVDADVDIHAAELDEAAALAAALGHLGIDMSTFPTLQTKTGATTRFSKQEPFVQSPWVERVAIPMADDAMHEGFLVETWTLADNLLNHTLVDGDGIVLSVELRTASDSYRVFAEDPTKGSAVVVDGPGTGNAQSPAGWLSGAQRDIAISGNNTRTYLDKDNNNIADTGGVTETDGVFDASFDLNAGPSTTVNKSGAVQNLFFLTNTVHDVLQHHGFNEAAGNFQTDNFGKGGVGNDPVNAEAQDGGGTDNANFATPADGSAPRMQMYLWSPTGATHEVVVGSVSSAAKAALFGPALTTAGLTGVLALANDGVGTTSDACEAMPSGSLTGKLALVDRGTCDFVIKTTNAKNAGAKGVVVINNVGTNEIFEMSGTGRKLISAVMVGRTDGATLKGLLGQSATERLKAVTPPMMDGAVDADIVFHEYGHGLTWRMVGGMSGKLAGAIGEGASDGLAMILNGDDIMGEYVYGSALGIRREPYDTYSLSYGDVTGAEVHNDGEVYAAIVWDLRKRFLAAGLPQTDLLNLYVKGLDFVPSTPDFEAMRDGMLQQSTAEDCLIWQAFAKFGVGVGADGRVTTRGVSITESFNVPAGCPAP